MKERKKWMKFKINKKKRTYINEEMIRRKKEIKN